MAYRLVIFGSTSLPQANAEWTFGPQANVQYIDLPGGGTFNPYSADRAPLTRPGQLVLQADLVESSAVALAASYDGLASLIGTSAKLYRQTVNGYHQWVYATLMDVEATRTPQRVLFLPVRLTWQIESRLWSGTGHGDRNGDPVYDTWFANHLCPSLSDKTTLTSGATIVVTNNGNANCDIPALTITAVGTAITYLKVSLDSGSGAVCEWEFTGTIVAGKTLVIDCMARSVKNNSADAWTYWARTANHNREPWLRLAPGANNVVVTFTGGGANSTILFTYSDMWT